MPPKRKPPTERKDESSPPDAPVTTKRSTASNTTGDQKRTNVVDLTTDDDAIPPMPEVALASSSSSSSAHVAVCDNKFYFVESACCSYTFNQLWAMDAHVRASLPPDGEKVEVTLPCLTKLHVGRFYFDRRYADHKSAGKLPAWLGPELPKVDWARTSGQTECPLTVEPFDRPHFLPANGRSYSLQAFRHGVAKTLMQGEPLRLEDITLTVLDIGNIRLHANYSLPGWEREPSVVRFPRELVAAEKLRFSAERAQRGNIPAVAALFDRVSPHEQDPDTHVDGRLIIEAYQAQHGTRSQSVENLIVVNAVFPRAHIKDGPALRNVLFRNCVMFCVCWCGMRFVGCRFENCMFIADESNLSIHAELCEMDTCMWMFQVEEKMLPVGLTERPNWISTCLRALKLTSQRSCIMARIAPGSFTTGYMMRVTYADLCATVEQKRRGAAITYRLSDT